MKVYLVVNPKSANGETGRAWDSIFAQVKRTVPSAEAALTQGPMHAARLAKDALKAGFDCITAVGGDGTINEVVNGFFENGKAINPNAALAVLPQGTGGDFRKTPGWGPDVASAIARLGTDRTEPFDVGVVDFISHDGSKASRYFANICSFGASGKVDREVNRTTKRLGGKASFMLGSVKALLRYKDATCRVSLDGKPAQVMSVTTLSVANGKYFGGGMKVCPNALTNDGIFDVTLWSGYTLADFALRQGRIYDGTHVTMKGTSTMRCTTLRAESDEEVLIDCDGEQPGRLPCEMRLLPAAIRLKV